MDAPSPAPPSKPRGRLPWLVGTATSAIVALLLVVPAWSERVETAALDVLFKYGRLQPPLASTSLVHVDIDENALDLIGRWPWPRARIGRALEAIDALGAKVIAVDLLFDDPSDDPADDRAFAESLARIRAKTVLDVNFPAPADWLVALTSRASGRRTFDSIVDRLQKDVTIEPAVIVRDCALAGDWSERVEMSPSIFKRIAALRTARALNRERRLSAPDLEARLVPESVREGSVFREKRILHDASEQVLVAEHLGARFPATRAGLEFLEAEQIQAPVRCLAETCTTVGSVVVEPDRDSVIRRLRPFVAHEGRLYPQLGLAAAVEFLGVPWSEVEIARDHVSIRGASVRVRDGFTLVPWTRLAEGSGPRRLGRDLFRLRSKTAAGALGLLRQSKKDRPSEGHVPIARILDVVDARSRLEKQESQFLAIGKVLTQAKLASAGRKPEDLDDPTKREEIYRELREEASFQLGDPPKAPTEDSEEARAFWSWVQLDRNIPASRKELDSAQEDLRRRIAGRLVFVGWTTVGDAYATVADALTPGVVINAMFANAFLTGYSIREAPALVSALVALFLGSLAAAAAGFGRVGPRTGLLVVLLLGLAYAMVNAFLVFDTGHIFVALTTPLAALLVGWSGATVTREVLLLREKMRLSKQFGARVHKQLFEFLLEHPETIHVEGVQREVTCIFTDLVGFTKISESLGSRETVALLNRCMGAMNTVLTQHGAYVNKFLGDGVMAVWGAFEDDPTKAEKACRAGLGCLDAIDGVNREVSGDPTKALGMRIGIATGVVTVGDCGAPPDFSDYTVIGDTANLASRLESANKQFGSKVLVNGATREKIGPEILVRPLGSITVVGQSVPTEIFEVVGLAATADERLRSYVDLTTRAVTTYRERKLEDSRRAWQELVATHGDSKLAHVYLEEIERRLAAPAEPFDGVIRLSAK